MKILYTEMKLDSHHLQLGFKDNRPEITLDGNDFDRLDKLMVHLPKLGVETFAVLANFLFSGKSFEVIKDVEQYKDRYKRLLKEDPQFAEYGNFNTEVIEKPRIEANQAIFYVEEVMTGLPFKVTCSFPYLDPSKPYAYKMLPFQKNKFLQEGRS